MSEHQTDLPMDEPSASEAAQAPDLKAEIARAFDLPLGERVEVTFRNGQLDAISGVLELVAAPDYPWNPRQVLQLRISGFTLTSREIARWTKV